MKTRKLTLIIILLFFVFSITIYYLSMDSNNNEIQYTYIMPNNVKLVKFNMDDSECNSSGVFINAKEGWKMNSIAVGMFMFDVTLYKTNDKGKNWVKIGDNSNPSSTIPIRGISAFIFNDRNNGWLTTNTPSAGEIGLYKTSDGGFTWLFQSINVPSKYIDYEITTNIPQFFSKEVGLLFLRAKDYDTDSGFIYFAYITVDGGTTWNFLEEDTAVYNTQWSVLEIDDKSSVNLVKYEVIYHGEKWESSWQDGTYVKGSWKKIN